MFITLWSNAVLTVWDARPLDASKPRLRVEASFVRNVVVQFLKFDAKSNPKPRLGLVS